MFIIFLYVFARRSYLICFSEYHGVMNYKPPA